MKRNTQISIACIALLILIQFIQPEKNIASADHPDDIFKHYPASAEVQAIVKKACYDCHSNNTNYPWYASVQPLAWWIDHHIDEGKAELNFSEFASYKPKKANHKMDELAEQVDEHEMPLNSYTIIHQEARLTDAERKLLKDWATGVRSAIALPK